MKIKDVEKRTGLTAKSIRHYESKGLLQVEREEGNSYRSYTEENLQELRKIRLLRFLDFSIDQIRDIQQMDAAQLKEVLLDKAESLENQSQDLEIKRNLCQTLSKDGISNEAVVEEYNEVFDALGEEWQDDLAECLKDLRCPSITEVIGETLLFSGAILWLFINIHDQKWHGLLLNALLAIFSTACITGIWINYLQKRRYQPRRVRKNNHATWYILPATVIACILGIALDVLIMIQIDKIFAPPGWLFSQMKPWAETLLIFLIMVPVMLFTSVLFVWLPRRFRKKSSNLVENAAVDAISEDGNGTIDVENEEIAVLGWFTFRKYWYLFVLVWIIAGYLCLTSVAYVTEDQIIIHSPFCPQGKSYSYEDVTKVQAGFGQKALSLHRDRRLGTFSYTITVGGKKIVFMQPSVNEQIARYEEDTYLELEELDQRLMQLGVDKESDETGYEDCDFDKQYVDRFRRIINNR
ncbi:MAG: MerR family transcriptional regulator [Lachnospiraceae bacterium]|nr:MerR family transcriptional regulator [Lachnospiraceae bacterium]